LSRPRRARGDVRWKQKGFAERDDFRLIAHLGALIVEAGEVGREQVAGDDLDAGLLERGDLRREVVAESGELPRIDDREAGILDRRNERVVPRRVVLRGIEQRADNLLVCCSFQRPIKDAST
jgi:hypothetical protein